MKTKYYLSILVLLAVYFMSGCSNDQAVPEDENLTTENQQSTGTLNIYTTIYPIEDFTKKIGGNHVTVTGIIPPGVDTHTFEPSTKTMIEIAEADAFIFNNKEMETYAGTISETLKNENVKIVEAALEVEEETHTETEEISENNTHNNEVHNHEDTGKEDTHDHNHGDLDPHIWIDPILSIQVAENIKQALIQLKPESKEDFEKNFENLKKQLTDLDQEFLQMVEKKTDPKIIVSHAAYGYWQKRYGIKQIAVTGLSPSNEPSQKQLEEIINIAKNNNIKYVIFEQNITPKISKIVQNELNAEALNLHNLEVLTEDDYKNGEDYFSIMRKNIQTLDIAMN
ncbi:metal ABC transporter solute-binding protein, Zn/Mn family [Bacillus sp. Marseille-P3661]|uniref:metal ABC transporter solute-binding protein, Zn/Mn family n=1 Tax=Bacillus sp. Marseille-P3661 TaxID=1936234 RepID=UPI000C84BA85|nr:zinc ABC transporter substrate-binding protein [Bacillus sp. Marseille-P3661]